MKCETEDDFSIITHEMAEENEPNTKPLANPSMLQPRTTSNRQVNQGGQFYSLQRDILSSPSRYNQPIGVIGSQMQGDQHFYRQQSYFAGQSQSGSASGSFHESHPNCQGPSNSYTMRVDGVDKDLALDLIELYFESPSSGGDSIEELTDYREQGYVLVTFENPEVINHVLEKEHVLQQKPLKVSRWNPSENLYQSLDPSRTLEVSGGEIVTDKETMELYFESSKKSGGGEIEKITVDQERQVAYITFAQKEVAAEVLMKSHTLCSVVLTVKQYKPPSTIRVSNLKQVVFEDLLLMYFENLGEVENIALDMKKEEALVTFANPSVVPYALNMKHRLKNSMMTVGAATSASAPSVVKAETLQLETELPQTIEVRGLDRSISKSTLMDYFENRRFSGGDIKGMDFDSNAGRAKITFQDVNVVTELLKRTHMLCGKQLKVIPFQPSVTSSPEAACQELTTVVVSGVTSSMSKDMLFNYFENSRRSGGGEIQDLNINVKKGKAHITFINSEVAAKVAARDHTLEGKKLTARLEKTPEMMRDRVLLTKLPSISSRDELLNFVEAKTGLDVQTILFGEKNTVALVIFQEKVIDFQKVISDLTKKQIKNKTLVVEQVPESCTILIRNLSKNQRPSDDTLRNYFENERRSSGSIVIELEFGGNGEYALITFENPQVAARVANRNHTLQSGPLEVELFTECLGIRGGSKELIKQ